MFSVERVKTVKHLVKQVLQKGKRIVNGITHSLHNRYNRKVHILNRGVVNIKDHWFDDFFGNIFWPNRAKEIGLHGGLGDVILLLPFLKKYKRKYPRRPLRVIYTDVRSDTVEPEKYGLGKTRLEKGQKGENVNPIKDFLENVSFINEKIGGDSTKAKEYWHPDAPFRRKWGRHPTPREYSKEFFPEIFSEEDERLADEFLRQNKLQEKFAIGFHFRRGADKIAEMYKRVLHDKQMNEYVKCLLLGSSMNEILPDIDFSGQINLIDNYEKEVPLRILYRIVMKAQLYIGGRGSFEHFFWLARVPSINFMDEEGYRKNINFANTWIPEFWSENKFVEKIFYETANPKDIFEKMIKPYFKEWQNKNLRNRT